MKRRKDPTRATLAAGLLVPVSICLSSVNVRASDQEICDKAATIASEGMRKLLEEGVSACSRKDPTNPLSYITRGQVYENKAAFEDAIADYSNAIRAA
jgi:hypothetical protein